MNIFVDNISLLSLIRILLIPKVETIWYFDPISPIMRRIVSIFKKKHLLPNNIHRIEYNISHIKSDSGESTYLYLFNKSREICLNIRKEHFDNNPVIVSMSSEWSYNKTVLFLEKIIEANINLECMRIGLVKWIMKKKLSLPMSQALILTCRQPWISYLKQFENNDINLRFYGYKLNIIKGRNIWTILSSIIKKVPIFLLKFFRKFNPFWLSSQKRNQTSGKNKSIKRNEEPIIGIQYYHRKISFDPSERSEFFFLSGEYIPYSSVLIYKYASEKPLSKETKRELKKSGIKLIGKAPGVSAWAPRKRMFLHATKLINKIIFKILTSRGHNRKEPLFLLISLSVLSVIYTYWYDFFQFNRIAINIGTNNTNIGQNMALDTLNSISVGYQYSASALLRRNLLRGSGENIQFVFSPYFKKIWQDEIHSPKVFVSTGFIHDKSVGSLKEHERVSKMHKSLKEKGVNFIISFFDENSINSWNIHASDDEVVHDYEFLFNWLIMDTTLGIIFKPKKPITLFQRIDRLSILLDKVKKTGRCKFIMSDFLYSNIFPAESALASDLCIGKIDGATAGIEAFLTGTPTIFIDDVGYWNHPFYSWGDRKIVFDSWNELKKTVEQYRKDSTNINGFGDLSPMMSEIDPFQDGNASQRIESYIGHIYKSMKNGAKKDDAIRSANDVYKNRWGNKHAIIV